MLSQFLIRIGVNSRGVSKGVNDAAKEFQKLGNQIKNYFGAGMIANEIRKIINLGSEINDTSRKMGISKKTFQEWTYAAKQSGVEITEVESAFRKMQIAQNSAVTKGGESAEAFERMGISIQELKTLNPEQLFRRVGEAASKMNPSARLTSDIAKIFGKGGASVISAFRDGFGDAIDEVQDKLLSDGTVYWLDKIGDAIDRLKAKWISMAAPGIVKLGGIAKTVSEFVGQAMGALGSAAGTIAGGGTMKEAMDSAVESIREDAKKAAESESKAEKPQLKSSAPTDFGDEKEKEKKKKKEREANYGGGEMSSDALRRIGLMRGAGPIASIPAQQLSEQRRANLTLNQLIARVETGNKVAANSLRYMQQIEQSLTSE